jgi:hypothetical protein
MITWDPIKSFHPCRGEGCTSGGATGYAGYAPAYPAILASKHVYIRISSFKKENNTELES